MVPSPSRHDTGVSLVETVVAVGLLGLLVASVLPVTGLAARAEHEQRLRAVALRAAVSHLERLRALPWRMLTDGSIVIDTTSRVSDDTFLPDGAGLLPAPAHVLETDAPRYVDAPVTGPAGVPGVPLTRRWDIQPHSVLATCRRVRVEVARTHDLASGEPMERAALARAQGLVCAAGAQP